MLSAGGWPQSTSLSASTDSHIAEDWAHLLAPKEPAPSQAPLPAAESLGRAAGATSPARLKLLVWGTRLAQSELPWLCRCAALFYTSKVKGNSKFPKGTI